MPTFRRARVEEILSERPGLQRLAVTMADGSAARAYNLTQLTGAVAVGDDLICNTTAVELDLGTGGWHFVHWNLARDELVAPGPDHIIKLRYTSLQADVGTSELVHPAAADAPLEGTPVVVCSVHSQVAMVALGFAAAAPGARLAYVMTDGAALPLAMSDLVAQLRERGLLVGSVTAGHAFGGDLEAVGVPSGLGLAAHVLHADAIVVGMGPGVVGTGTAMGNTGIETASLVDLAMSRGGRAVLCVRASDGDDRGRHRGISHHVETALSLCHAAPLVAHDRPDVEALTGVELREQSASPDPAGLLAAAGMRVTTMGRDHTEDPRFFAAATAAGVLAADLLERP